jgi:ligand-binding sensor domain-containing protein/signal transduction histidine kinase/DNA-binding response OmpR family regulator
MGLITDYSFISLIMSGSARLLFMVFLSFQIGTVLADPSDPFFTDHYDNRNGLSNSSINYIFKDASNMLWVATWDGLNMYDGISFHVFNYSKENDFKSIGSNVIQYITEDRLGNIWISTIEGISRFEKKTGKFYNYFYDHNQRTKISEQEYALAVDTSGLVYCHNQKSGLSYYDPKVDSFRNCALPEYSSKINKIAFDKQNHLWVLNGNGELDIYSLKSNQFKRLHTYGQKQHIANFYIINSQVFFSTSADQLFVIDYTAFNQKQVMQMKHGLSSIIFYKDHYLLAWSTKGYDIVDNNFQPSSFLATESEQMAGMKVTSWSLGSEDILWYGTDGNGIIKVYPKTKSFGTISTSDNGVPYNRSVRAFCEENGNLWLGTKGSGIIRFQNFWTSALPVLNKQYFSAPSELDNNSVYSLKKGNDELIYIGTDAKGLGVYDLKNKRFNKWSDIKGYDTCVEFGSVYHIYQDQDSSLWLGTSGYGLVHLKINRDKSGQFSLAFLERFMFNNSNTGPANDIIYALAAGDGQQLWIGCRYGGLNLFNKKTKKFRTFKAFTYEGSLSNNDVLFIYRDSRSRVWIGTSYGLNWIENANVSSEEPIFQKLTTADGLPNNTIHTIEEDRMGNIWVSTNKGLAKVNQASLKVWYYQQSDGLQSNEFCDGAVWKDKLDNLFFGGTYGFNHFSPQDIRKTSWRPNLLLSGILMGGKITEENGFVVLNPDSNQPLDFSIDRKDNFFELNIKAISFLNAEKCEYAYFLDGYDKSWHTVGQDGKIVFSNVPPGSYTLQIKWSNGDGIWTNQIPLLNVEVKQYFWLTTFAFLVYALIVSVLAVIIYRYRQNKLEIKHQLAVEHVLRTKEEEIHQDRIGFFTNIAHELQTPLTLIMGSAERFQEKTAGIQNKKEPYFLSLIHQQASRLTYLLRQLLEFRKAEAGFLKNQYSLLNTSELLNNLAEPFISMSEQSGVKYEVNISPGMTGWVDKDKLEKIIFNLLSNAFKHSGKNEQIIFSAEENKVSNEFEITIANSGVQLSGVRLDQLFEKFYVANQNGFGTEKFGTGIGLAFTQQLVTVLNGRISATNENGWIIFKVFLPVPDAVEIAEGRQTTSNRPSYLYQAITSYTEPVTPLSAVENNKLAAMENLQGDKREMILVVEDEPGIRYLLKDILRDDYIIYEAENGEKALELIEKITPDLIICDVLMPAMNGLELCNKIKNDPDTCQIPFILLSARTREDHHMEGYEAGADAYIAKPFHTAHLKLRIRKLLEYRHRIHELFRNGKSADLLAETEMASGDKIFLTKMTEIIEENLDEPELSAAFIEKAFAISKMQLFRKVKSLTGLTPGEFIKHTRLKHAAHLLASTPLTVSEIFYHTGFNNQSYFFREFKKRYNCSPNEYRERKAVKK